MGGIVHAFVALRPYLRANAPTFEQPYRRFFRINPPAELIDPGLLRGLPRHGIGRGFKVSKEQILALLTAVRLFVAGAYDGEPALKRALAQNGGLWVAWPKQASGVRTDLNERVVRRFGLGQGLVDNKVCAIDETWSGLRFVVRLADRP